MTTPLPRVIKATHRGGYRIHLVFDDGAAGVVDCSAWVGRGPLFSRLADHKYFTRFVLDGESIEWPNGASIAPEALHDAVSGTAARRPTRRRTRTAS